MGLAEKVKELAGEEGLNFRSGYSGRGMYNRECVGVVAPDMASFLTFFARLVRQVEEDDVDALTDVRQDSMGRQIIFYWPSIQADEEEDEEDSDDSEFEEDEDDSEDTQ